MAKKVSINALKILEQGTIKQKENMVQKTPGLLFYVKPVEQLYFLNQDANKFFKYCDDDIKEFMMNAFPDYYVAFTTREEKEIYTDCGVLDPGYIEGTLEPAYMDEETLTKTIMCYAEHAGIKVNLQKDFPQEFKGVKPALIR